MIKILYDGCIDFAIEAYLLGAEYGKFGYHGEPVHRAMIRSEKEEKQLLHELYEYAVSWSEAFNVQAAYEPLYYLDERVLRDSRTSRTRLPANMPQWQSRCSRHIRYPYA